MRTQTITGADTVRAGLRVHSLLRHVQRVEECNREREKAARLSQLVRGPRVAESVVEKFYPEAGRS